MFCVPAPLLVWCSNEGQKCLSLQKSARVGTYQMESQNHRYCVCIRLRFSFHQIFACLSVNLSRLPHSNALIVSKLSMFQQCHRRSRTSRAAYIYGLFFLRVISTFAIGFWLLNLAWFPRDLWSKSQMLVFHTLKLRNWLKQKTYLNLTRFKSLAPPGKIISVR
jgi:hypothetical protein